MAAADVRSLDVLIEDAERIEPTRGFAQALAAAPQLAVIAEIKRRSPSKGDLDAGLDPADLAATYARGGASCLSVLTDSEFFGGSVDDLQAARRATPLPVLRKDFTVAAHDVADARLMGADAVLLIAAALDPAELIELHRARGRPRPRRARRGPRRARAGDRRRGGRHAGRGQPTRPGDVRGRPRAGRADGGGDSRRCRQGRRVRRARARRRETAR